jgi:hypothetical protein
LDEESAAVRAERNRHVDCVLVQVKEHAVFVGEVGARTPRSDGSEDVLLMVGGFDRPELDFWVAVLESIDLGSPQGA